jgi:two-component system sensor histidine kinase KdpD
LAEVIISATSDTRKHTPGSYWKISKSQLAILRGYFAGLAAVVTVTLCAYQLHLNLSSSGSLYFLAVVLVSVSWGFGAATATSLIAVNCLNFFFVPPVLTWRVSDPQNWVALATFEITALCVSRLSARVRGQANAEAQQRMQVEKLYELSRRILLLDRRPTIRPQILSLVREIFRAEVALFDARPARLDDTGSQANDLEQLARRAYFLDRTLEDGHAQAQVLRLGSKPVGAIALCRGPAQDRLTVASIASLAAIALERATSFETESRAEAARQTEQLRTAVLDSLAHAFKTPLTAIRVASTGLIETGHLRSEDMELAELIDEQAEHLSRLTSELLQMARIDTAEVRLRREHVPVLGVIEDALARSRQQLQDRQIDVPSVTSHLEVHGDRDLLVTGLEQFLDNASKYSTPGSLISISAEEKLGEIIFGVHNEGLFIRPADRERIFERFYRTEESRHRAAGTGLGLSIAKKVAEAHGGRTWVVSEEGAGTTFFFALPRGIKEPV